MPLPSIDPLPSPPNPDVPSTFSTLAYPFTVAIRAMAAQFATLIAALNALLPTLAGGGWATYAGTANAIVLTADYTALFRGMQVRFRATASNTGAATINLDGLGAKACRTITGAVLPAGYIRTGVDTLATYDGTNWILDRQIERGENANGTFVRWADGTQECKRQTLNLTYLSVLTMQATWTYPAAFSADPDNVQATLIYTPTQPSGAHFADLTSPQAVSPIAATTSIRCYRTAGGASFGASDIFPCTVSADGRWY